MDKEIIEFLKKCKLQLEDETQLEGQLIPRDILLSPNTYEEVKAEIAVLKICHIKFTCASKCKVK